MGIYGSVKHLITALDKALVKCDDQFYKSRIQNTYMTILEQYINCDNFRTIISNVTILE